MHSACTYLLLHDPDELLENQRKLSLAAIKLVLHQTDDAAALLSIWITVLQQERQALHSTGTRNLRVTPQVYSAHISVARGGLKQDWCRHTW